MRIAGLVFHVKHDQQHRPTVLAGFHVKHPTPGPRRRWPQCMKIGVRRRAFARRGHDAGHAVTGRSAMNRSPASLVQVSKSAPITDAPCRHVFSVSPVADTTS